MEPLLGCLKVVDESRVVPLCHERCDLSIGVEVKLFSIDKKGGDLVGVANGGPKLLMELLAIYFLGERREERLDKFGASKWVLDMVISFRHLAGVLCKVMRMRC